MLLIILSLFFVSCSYSKDIDEEDVEDVQVPESKYVGIIAHRGYWNCKDAGKAQNSIASLKAAQEAGFWGSEFDVRPTRDDSLIVFHDARIDGIPVDGILYAEMQKKKLPNGESIPTLHEYLTQAEESVTTRLVMEIEQSSDNEKVIENCIKALKMHGLLDPKRVIFISFGLSICQYIQKICPDFTVQYLSGNIIPADLRKKGVKGIDYQYEIFYDHPEWIRQARNKRMSVNTWTINGEDDMRNLIDMGAEYITTDKPELLRDVLEKSNKIELSDK